MEGNHKYELNDKYCWKGLNLWSLLRAPCEQRKLVAALMNSMAFRKYDPSALWNTWHLKNANVDICIIVKLQILNNFVPF